MRHVRGIALGSCALVVTLAATAVLGGCGILTREPLPTAGPTVSEQRSVSGFERVSFSGSGNLTVEQGPAYSLEVSAPQGVLDTLKTEVRGNTLYIRRPGLPGISILDFAAGDPNVDIKLTLPALSGIGVSGAGNATVTTLTAAAFDAKLSGASHLVLEHLAADSLRAEISGAGNMVVSGIVARQDVGLSGASSYDARSLGSVVARINASGASNASVAASSALTANLSGGARVDYFGNPTVTQHTSGGARVTHAQ